MSIGAHTLAAIVAIFAPMTIPFDCSGCAFSLGFDTSLGQVPAGLVVTWVDDPAYNGWCEPMFDCTQAVGCSTSGLFVEVWNDSPFDVTIMAYGSDDFDFSSPDTTINLTTDGVLTFNNGGWEHDIICRADPEGGGNPPNSPFLPTLLRIRWVDQYSRTLLLGVYGVCSECAWE